MQSVGVPSSQLRFLVVQESRGLTDTTIGAVCVFPPGVSTDSLRKAEGLEYGCVADRLFLPVEACLYPKETCGELDGLLPVDQSRLFVWHPTVGLVGYDSEHVLTVADLLSAPAIDETRWREPAPDQQINRKIRLLSPEATPDVEEMFDHGQDDIGSESDNLDNAPRSPDEKSGEAMRDGLQSFKRRIGKAIYRITSRLPDSANGSKTLGRLHRWAAILALSGRQAGTGQHGGRTPRRPDRGMTTRRENEIKRLLNMLRNDPDKGLKFAPPMFDGNRGRGIADATDRLAQQDLEFDPYRMQGGGGAADAWDIPWEYQIKLMQEYRELAQREQKLGRHRRAAYIYARLLHDLPASAAALEAGKHYRDAAAIYAEHLQNPVQAANCLRAGGFWEEAVQIYTNRELWIEAGELHQELGQPEKSREMYGRAIRNEEVKRNYIAAAGIADKRLNDPELASELFVTGWMQATNGKQCFQELLQMQGRRGMHDAAVQSLRQMTDTAYLSLDQMNDALAVCSRNAEHYPDETVRDSSRKHSWRLAALLLNRTDPYSAADHKLGLAAIRSLGPKDRLLQTDSVRFEMEQDAKTSAAKPVDRKRRNNLQSPRLIGRYMIIPEGTNSDTIWTQVVCNGSFLFRIGCNQDIILVRQAIGVRRDGRISTQDDISRLPRPQEIPYADFQLQLDSDSPDQAWVSVIAAFAQQNYPDLTAAIQESHFESLPNFQDGKLLAFHGTATGWLFALLLCLDEPRVEFRIINCRNSSQNILKVDVSLEEVITGDAFVRLIYHTDKFYAVFGQSVVELLSVAAELQSRDWKTECSIRELESLPFAPIEMVASPAATAARLVFAFETGARAIWPGQHLGCSFAQDLESPLLAFSTNGILAAACQQTNRIEFWRLNSGEAILHAQHQADDPITHLMCGPAPNQILAFHSDGSVSQLAIPTSYGKLL